MSTDLKVEGSECSVVTNATLLRKFSESDPTYLFRYKGNCDHQLGSSTWKLPDFL